MICKLTLENYKVFANRVDLDFYANGNIKRFDYNYETIQSRDVLKTIGFYGPNNTGKTCLLLSLASLRALMLNEPHENLTNAFANKGDVTSFSVEYCINGRFYLYSVSYNNRNRQYEKESLILKSYSADSATSEKIFERSKDKLNWNGMGNAFKKANVLSIFSPSFPFMLLFNDEQNKVMSLAKKDYFDFADSILLLRMDGPLDIGKTINLMQTDKKARFFVKEFVKNCDLHIADFGFDENIISDADINYKLQEVINNPSFDKETLKFYSKHNGYRVPSILFDSVGTLKLVALSGYIYDALRNGKTLIVDEISSSLHHIVTKSIVAMFSNMLNKKAQLIFTTHDVLLLDLKELFRKDQIWLVDVLGSSSSKVTRLSSFTSRSENGIRGDEDITEYYLKGQFGSIPSPDLFSSLLMAGE